jgi:hypothetical protein
MKPWVHDDLPRLSVQPINFSTLGQLSLGDIPVAAPPHSLATSQTLWLVKQAWTPIDVTAIGRVLNQQFETRKRSR